MWLRADTRFMLLIAIFCISLAWNIAGALTTEAQIPEVNDMQSYLQYLKEAMQEDPEFQVAFRFHKPLLDTEEDWWYLPYIADDSEIHRAFNLIGEDFVCFTQSTGTTPVVSCTPYSNIVTVNFGSF